MTKLYHNGDAWQVPGQQDKKANRADVPNSPGELAAWLNERGVPAILASDTVQTEIVGYERKGGQLGEQRQRTDEPSWEPPAASSAEHIEARRMAMGRCPRCNGTPRGADRLLKGEEKDSIVDWIAEADELWQLEAIAIAVKERLASFKAGLEEQGGVQ